MSPCTYAVEPPCTGRYARWCERSAPGYGSLLLDSLDQDGHFAENIIDESVDVEKIVETQMMIEAVRNAISRLNAEERDIIERLYFQDETLSSIARRKKVSYQAIQWRKNNILKKLKLLLEDFLR